MTPEECEKTDVSALLNDAQWIVSCATGVGELAEAFQKRMESGEYAEADITARSLRGMMWALNKCLTEIQPKLNELVVEQARDEKTTASSYHAQSLQVLFQGIAGIAEIVREVLDQEEKTHD